MAIDTFTKLQAELNAQKVVFVEIEPYRELTSFTALGGTTNVYYATHVSATGSDLQLSRVREDENTLYTEQTEVEDVDSNPGSFYYDARNGVVYLHTSDSSNPSTKTIVIYFWLYYATEQKQPMKVTRINDYMFFEPIVKKASVFTRGIEFLDGAMKKQTISKLILDNSKDASGYGIFDTIYTDYIWQGAAVNEIVGGESLPYSQYQLAGSLIIDQIEKNTEEVGITLSDNSDFLTRELPLNVYDISTYPNLENGKEGADIPLGWGLARDFRPTRIDVLSVKKYKCYDHNAIILAAYDNQINVGFIADNDNGELTLNALLVGELTIDAVGQVGTNLLTNASFETHADATPDTFTGWTNFLGGGDDIQATTTATQYVDGTQGVALTRTSGSSVGFRQDITLAANTWYRIAYYGKSDGNVTIVVDVRIGAAGNYLQSDRTWSGSPGALLLMTTADTGDMRGKSMAFKSGVAGTYRISVLANSGTGTGYVDLVTVATTDELKGAVVKDVCDNYIDLGTSFYNSTSLTDLDTDRPYPQGFIIEKKTKASEVFASMGGSIAAYYFFTRGGILTLDKWAEPSVTADDDYDRFNFIGMKEAIENKNLKWKIKTNYAQWLTDGRKSSEEAEDTAVKYKYRLAEELEIDTLLQYGIDAAAVAAIYLNLYKKRTHYVTLRSVLQPLLSDISDTVSLTKKRFNDDAIAKLYLTGLTEDWNTKESVLTAFKLLDT